MLHITQQKEQFSLAFIRAVTAVAGYNICRQEVDNDSIDIGVRGTRRDGGTRKAPQLDMQVKCTEMDAGAGDACAYDLKLKNYDDLRLTEVHIPVILVIICVPQDVSRWIEDAPEQMALRRCAYWLSLRGAAQSENMKAQRVHVPRSQRFTVDALRQMMNRLGDGGLP